MTKIRQLMDDCGLSTRGCSRHLGVPFETLRNMMYGKIKTPEDALIKLTALKTVTEKIFGEENEYTE